MTTKTKTTTTTTTTTGTRHVEAFESRILFATMQVAGFTDESYRGGLSGPTAMEFAPDGRLFVCEQGGNVRVIDAAGNLLTNSFVSLNVDSAGERGVLGVAFDPSFSANGFVYVYYTVPNGPDGSSGAFNRVSRFTAVDADPGAGYAPGNTAVTGPGSETVVLNLNTLSGATNHNGGALHFSPTDGKLYLAVGDNANSNNAETLANHHGKILRMNTDGSAPSDNPFNDADADPAEPRDYIWAWGLRNPFTTAFDPVTGRFHINDVGQSTWEEVNLGIAGANYGWNTHEGPENLDDGFTAPIFAYNHTGVFNDTGDVISGGTFYRPAAHTFPSSYTGEYFFSEAGHGWIRSFDVATNTATLFATGASFPVDLKTGNDGALYYLERGSGSVRRIRRTDPPPQVTNVFVSSTAWTTAYKNSLATNGTGEAAFGYRIPAGEQTRVLPWSNLNQVSVRFSENVNVASDDLVVNGVNVTSYGVGAFAYDATTRTATWTLAQPIPNDKVTLNLDSGAGTGVTDTSPTPNRLDGEWTNPVSPSFTGDTFNSGNGDAGGDFVFNLRVLPGDINRDEVVNVFDFNVLRPNLNVTGAGVLLGDINGDNVVNVFDFNDFRTHLGRTTPA